MLARPMEAQPRSNVPAKQTPAAKPAVIRPGSTGGPAGGPAGFFNRHGNTILTVALLIAAGVLAYRWWARSAESAKSTVVVQLQSARGWVQRLRDPGLDVGPDGYTPLRPNELMAKVRDVQQNAAGLVSDVINKTDDAGIKARALVVRGDLDWAVASLPEVPGAATQPSLRPDPPSEVLMGQAADAYGAVLSGGGADPESVEAAHLGLAAVCEDRGDWAGAKQHLQAVADDKNGISILSQAARTQLAELPTFEKPIYVAPPTGVPLPPMPAVTAPSKPPTPGPMGPARPATQPATTQPAK